MADAKRDVDPRLLEGTGRMELLSQYSVDALREGLAKSEPVRYCSNGNRTRDPEEFLATIEALAPRIGIERVAEISGLAPYEFPVFQSTRPNVLHHGDLGQNTGAQGKGLSRVQAQISCIMESLELFCAEPRAARLVRGSYEWLRGGHLVVPPDRLFRREGSEPARRTEPLMWTEALLVGSGEPILVPAESVYFYFTPGTYTTRSLFPMGTSGLASGATYLEAVNHGIYELIERMYVALRERGDARMDQLFEEELEHEAVVRLRAFYGTEYRLHLFTSSMPDLPNLPMVTAYLVSDHDSSVGHGCASDIDTAIGRAVSEALQSLATAMSGSREDVRGRQLPPPPDVVVEGVAVPRRGPSELPRERTLHLRDWRTRVIDRRFDELRTELDFLLGWLKEWGFPEVCVANLTRHGIDIPVVKVLVPAMPIERISQCLARPQSLSEVDVARLRFPLPGGPKGKRPAAEPRS